MVDAASGNVVGELPGHRGPAFSYAQVPGTALVVSAGEQDGETIIFDLGPAPSAKWVVSPPGLQHSAPWGLPTAAPTSGQRMAESLRLVSSSMRSPATWMRPFQQTLSSFRPTEGLPHGPTRRAGRSSSSSEGREVFVAPDGWDIWGISDNGSLAVITGPSTRVIRTSDGSLVAELDAGPGVYEDDLSPDLRFVVTNNGDRVPIRIWDVSNGDLLGALASSVDFDCIHPRWQQVGRWRRRRSDQHL